MKHQFEVRLSPSEADTALKRFLFRGTSLLNRLLLVLAIGIVVFNIVTYGIKTQSMIAIGLLLVLASLYPLGYTIRRKRNDQLLERLGDNPVSYSLNDSSVEITSPIGDIHFPWEKIKKVWVDEDLVMIFFSRREYTTIPAGQISPAALDFLVSRVSANGGKVIKRSANSKQS